MLLFLSACSTTLPVNYVASTSSRGDAEVTVNDFSYVPANEGKVQINQFQKNPSAIGQIYVSPDVPALIKSALKKELAYSGYRIEETSKILISGDIDKFYYDWVGFTEVDFEVGITFHIKDNDQLIFDLKTLSHQKAPKTPAMAQDTEAVKAAIADCIEQFLMAAKTRKVL